LVGSTKQSVIVRLLLYYPDSELYVKTPHGDLTYCCNRAAKIVLSCHEVLSSIDVRLDPSTRIAILLKLMCNQVSSSPTQLTQAIIVTARQSFLSRIDRRYQAVKHDVVDDRLLELSIEAGSAAANSAKLLSQLWSQGTIGRSPYNVAHSVSWSFFDCHFTYNAGTSILLSNALNDPPLASPDAVETLKSILDIIAAGGNESATSCRAILDWLTPLVSELVRARTISQLDPPLGIPAVNEFGDREWDWTQWFPVMSDPVLYS
jgi:hypothetical protein